MQFPDFTTLTLGQILLGLAVAALSGGTAVALVNKLIDWRSGRSNAEVVEIHARSVKFDAEAQTASAAMLMQAMERIRELVDINRELQEELSETGRQRDNCEFELQREREGHEQLKIRSDLREHFIQQLEAANKLGIRFKDLPQVATALGLDVKVLIKRLNKIDLPKEGNRKET